MKYFIELVIKFLYDQGLRTIVVNKEISDIDLSCFKIEKVFDRRSMGYFALGLSQQLEEIVGIIVEDDDETIADLLPGVTEALYQSVPILLIVLHKEDKEWLISTNSVIGDKCVYTTKIKKQDLENFEICSVKINEAYLALKERRGGPVLLEIDEFACCNNQSISKIEKFYESDITENHMKINSILKNTFFGILSDRYTICNENDLKIIKTFSNYYNCEIILMDNCDASLDNRYDLILQIGHNVSCEISCDQYWVISNNKLLRECKKVPEYVYECDWREMFQMLLGDHCNTLERLVGNEHTMVICLNSWNVENIIQYILSKFNTAPYIFGKVFDKYNIDLNSVLYNPLSSGNDGCLSIFVGNCVAANPKICICFCEAREFFLDMNALHIRHLGTNARICLLASNYKQVQLASKWAISNNLETLLANKVEELEEIVDKFIKEDNKSKLLIVSVDL